MSWAPVYRWVRQIPRGRVVTYGQVARALRLPGGGRTAGRAMAACPPGVPWHRVLGAGGRLLTREPYSSFQRQLLAREGIEFLGARVNMVRHHWHPARVSPSKRRSRACT
ncbi:MAG TPA: MGMT family protein [Candidatus Acidoferrales bacterium]|nr:MGMT family protein [Candidatus Acidoferrales bacterium]